MLFLNIALYIKSLQKASLMKISKTQYKKKNCEQN